MTQDPTDSEAPGERTGWRDRVAFSFSLNERFAYVPNQVLVLGSLTEEQVAQVALLGLKEETQSEEQAAPASELGLSGKKSTEEVELPRVKTFTSESEVPLDVPLVVRQLQAFGITAQPNHVLFADAPPLGANPLLANPLLANPLLANPLLANPLLANPLLANPLLANPLLANPLLANPLLANPLLANPTWRNPLWGNPAANPNWTSRVPFRRFLATGIRRSTAVPVHEKPKDWPGPPDAADGPRVVVLDTGYSAEDTKPTYIPAGLHRLEDEGEDVPDKLGAGGQEDGCLDPVAGHGTFIAGLIARLEPTVKVEVRHLVEPEGDASETTLISALEAIANETEEITLVNLSLSGYALDEMEALRSTMAYLQAKKKNTVVVASAGNDGICIPTYPASLPGVISVGAIGPGGAAPFTNWGPWVRACAPGVGIVSSFFNWNGAQVAPAGVSDPDSFSGWAQWDGTSFSAPIVVGAIAHEMVTRDIGAPEAVERLIDAPGLMRIPNLGTVVNVL